VGSDGFAVAGADREWDRYPMDQRQQLAAVFDAAAPTYDRVGVEFFQPIAEGLVQQLAPVVGERVLDVGCGRGAVLLRLAASVGETGEAIGLDLAPEMVAAATEEAARAGVRVKVLVADAEDPQLPAASLDAVTASLVLFFLPDPAAALLAWRNLLVDGGRTAVATFGPYSSWWNPVDDVFTPYLPPGMRDARTSGKEGPFTTDEGVERLLADAGFTEVRTVNSVVPVRFDDAEHWHRWTMSTGQRFFWQLVPGADRDEVQARAYAAVEDTRQHTSDGRMGFDQEVRYTMGRR
jgi:ubiquinone/menaquinone biosynthesis C-methylase UbiE